MYALVAFKRPDPANAGKFQVGFEVRNFGCFNGFNNMEAFTHREHFDLMFNNVNPDGTMYAANASGNTVLNGLASRTVSARDQLTQETPVPSQWTCLGIGFMIHQLGDWSGPANAASVDHDRPAPFHLASKQGNNRISKLVNWAGIYKEQRQIYDDVLEHRSNRVFTENEEFLNKLFSQVSHANGGYHIAYTWANRNTESRFAQALGFSRMFMYTLHQWVGSERPSGLAVSYLQIWRNVVQGAHEGFTSRRGMTTFLQNVLSPNWTTTYDPMPLLSCLINGGSDSDIVSFAGPAYVAYAIRWGLLNCKDMYRESIPMIQERRYNKGGQSDFIRAELVRKLGQRRDVTYNTLHAAADAAVARIVDYTASVKSLHDSSDLSMLLNYAGRPEAEFQINQRMHHLTQLLQRMMSASPVEHIRGLLQAANTFPDLALPPPAGTPETASDGAAMGFTQWVATAEPSATIH